MAYVEIEYDDFVKALRLLHSRTPESSDELKKMLDSYYVKQMNNDAKKSKDFSNVISALQSLNQDVRSESERRTRPSEDDSEATDIEDNENPDGGDFASDLGLACVVCKGIGASTNNQLFECNECRLMYHQECHKPPITKKDLNDPRLVWYCFKCNKSIKKVGKPISQNKLVAGKTAGSSMSLQAGISSVSPSASPYSISHQTVPSKEPNSKQQSNFMKISDADKSASQQTFKRGPGKFASFAPSYTASNTKPSSTMGSVSRPASSSALLANKGKITSSAGNTTSSFSPVNAMTSLDKRFPNLKKAKMAKYNN